MIEQPIPETIIDKLKPNIHRLLSELNVTYAEFKNTAVTFHYKGTIVTIQVKTKKQ